MLKQLFFPLFLSLASSAPLASAQDLTVQLQVGLSEFNLALVQKTLEAGIRLDDVQNEWYEHLKKGFIAQKNKLGSSKSWGLTEATAMVSLFENYKAFLIMLRNYGVSFDVELDGWSSFKDSWNLQYPFLRDMIHEFEATMAQRIPEMHKTIAQQLIKKIEEIHEVINR